MFVIGVSSINDQYKIDMKDKIIPKSTHLVISDSTTPFKFYVFYPAKTILFGDLQMSNNNSFHFLDMYIYFKLHFILKRIPLVF